MFFETFWTYKYVTRKDWLNARVSDSCASRRPPTLERINTLLLPIISIYRDIAAKELFPCVNHLIFSFLLIFSHRWWVGGPSLETIYLWLSIRIIIFHYIKMELFLWLDNTRYMVSFLLKIPEFGSSFRKTDKYKREIQIILFNLFIKKDL